MSKKMAVRRVAATTALGVGLVAGGAGLASATSTQSARDSTTPTSSPPNRANMAGGLVTAVTDSSITVKDRGGTSTTYAITSATAFYEGPTTIAQSSLAVGQHVEIELSADSTQAQSIDVQVPVLIGTVTAVNGDAITISDLEGFSRTIVVDSSTTYTKSGAAATLGDVSVGTLISAEGAVDTNLTSLDATSVSMGRPTAPQGGPGPGGPGFGGPGFGPLGAYGPPPSAS